MSPTRQPGERAGIPIARRGNSPAGASGWYGARNPTDQRSSWLLAEDATRLVAWMRRLYAWAESMRNQM